MANIWEKDISILAGNLNSGLSYLITTVYFFKRRFCYCIFCPVMLSKTICRHYYGFSPSLERIKSNKHLAWIMIFVICSWIVHELYQPKKCVQPLGCPDIQGICTFRLDTNLILSICWVIFTEFIIPTFIS